MVELLEAIDSGDGGGYLVMERLDYTLQECMEEAVGGMSADERLALARKLFAAVAHAHEAGYTFVDLKPHNAMCVHRYGNTLLKLVDVGSARVTGMRLGDPLPPSWTPMYGSPEAAHEYSAGPEVFANMRAAPSSDVYSLGLILAQLLDDGFNPVFTSDEDAMGRLLDEPPRLPRDRLLCGGSVRAQDLLRRMLDPEPARRPKLGDVVRQETLLNPGMVSIGLALGAKIEGVGLKIEGVGVSVARAGAAAAGAKDAAEATLDAALSTVASGSISVVTPIMSCGAVGATAAWATTEPGVRAIERATVLLEQIVSGISRLEAGINRCVVRCLVCCGDVVNWCRSQARTCCWTRD